MNVFVTTFKRKNQEFISKFRSGNLRTKAQLLWRTTFFALCYVPLLLLAVVLVPIVVVLAKVLESVIKVRIGKLTDDRIGHLAFDTDLYLRRQRMGRKVWKEYYILLSEQVANQQLLTMIKRQACVLRKPLFLKLYKAAYAWMPRAGIWADLPCDYNAFEEHRRVPPQFYFTAQEEARGKQQLSALKIGENDPFVCIHARDKSYLQLNKEGQSWSRHDYRDGDILSCLSAANYLAARGIFVLRMGHTVEQAFQAADEKIVDYASKYRSDFMDVYLSGNCKFFLGDTAGLHCVALALGVPVAAVNWIPLRYALPRQGDIFIPKKLWDIKEKRFLTFTKIITSGIDGWLSSEQYVKAGIEIVNNTADEILALTKEMNARLDRTWITTPEDEELQQRYHSLFPKGHYSYGFPSRIGTEFLRHNQELLGERTRETISVHS